MQVAGAHRSSCSLESTRTTPSEAAPEMGLMTAGKPTTSAAFATSAEDRMRWLAGVGSPARFMHALVFCRAQHSSSNTVVL